MQRILANTSVDNSLKTIYFFIAMGITMSLIKVVHKNEDCDFVTWQLLVEAMEKTLTFLV